MLIKRCGYHAFDEEANAFRSGHRMLRAGIGSESIFGHYPPRLCRKPIERVQSNNPLVRQRYIKMIKKGCKAAAGAVKVASELGRAKPRAAGLQVQAMAGLEVNFQPRQVLQ